MAYKFESDEPVRAAFVRCAREQLDRAVADLSEPNEDDRARAVHNARKALKKERSLLRLARGAMPAGQRRRENAALRDAARELSSVRDADVRVATMGSLSERFAGQLPAKTFDAICERLKSHSAANGAQVSGSRLNARAVEQLGVVRARMDDWRLAAGGFNAIEEGLSRSYTRGRKAFARARESRSLEDLHAWRKRVKDLWYHQRLLTKVSGPTADGLAKDAHRLADLLGDDHDLALLRRELTSDAMSVAVDVDAVVKLIDHRRNELQTEAMALGMRVYAESPRAFIRRQRRAWAGGRALARAPRDNQPAELAAATRTPPNG